MSQLPGRSAGSIARRVRRGARARVFRPRQWRATDDALDRPFVDARPDPAVVSPARRGWHQRRGIYLLPNAFTTGGLFAGFYAIVMAMNNRFAEAAIAIFLAMVLDSLDGRVARLTNTQSAFGEQYDSLADMVSFGAAPALVAYAWALKGMGKWGWLAAFIYVAGAALRLARFNTNIGVVDKRYFQGLPSPAAAALVAGLVWVFTDLREAQFIELTGRQLDWLAFIVTMFGGITMVVNVPFHSFKDLNLKRRLPFVAAFLLVLALVVVVSNPAGVLFALFVTYGLSGYVLWGYRRMGRHLKTLPPRS